MANLIDYIDWRGDLPLDKIPFGDVDAAILSTFCYLDLPEAEPERTHRALLPLCMKLHDMPSSPDETPQGPKRRNMAAHLLHAPRYDRILVHDFVRETDAAAHMQFAAMTFDLPGGAAAIAFRGTDSSLIGWREDFELAYENAIPAQKAALAYLTRRAAFAPGDLYVMGHSKGGNLAVWACAHAPEHIRRRVRTIWSFDSPGVDDATFACPGWADIQGVTRALIPQDSVIGLLMNSHPAPTIVHAEKGGLLQHDLFTWQVMGAGFVTGEKTAFAEVTDRVLHDWLAQCTPDQRRSFVDGLFQMLEASGAATTTGIKRDVLKSVGGMAQALVAMEPETRSMMLRLMSKFVSLAASSAVDVGLQGDWLQPVRALLKMNPDASPAE